MALSPEARLKKQREAAQRAQERALAKQRAKWNDPEEREKARQKQAVKADKQRARQLEKLNDPEYRAQQLDRTKKKQEQRRQRALSAPATSTKPRKTAKKVISKGLKGRVPTAQEREIMNKIGALPCLACMLKGRLRPLVSLHHMDGRMKPMAHAKVLPLCAEHHDTPVDKASLVEYPDMVPYHARGNLGGKTQWRQHHGDEWEMLAIAYALVEITPEFELPEVSIERLDEAFNYYLLSS